MSSRTDPIVSIVTVVRNGGSDFRRTLESIVVQRDERMEYVVVDGLSTDVTPGIIRQHRERIDAFVSEQDSGIYDAMNKGVLLSKAPLICFVNAGDELMEGALDLIAGAFENAGKRVDVVYYGDYEWRSKTGGRVKRVTASASGLRKGMTLCHQATYIPRAVYDRFGLYDSRFKLVADYFYLLRLRGFHVPFIHVPGVLIRFYGGGASDANFFRQKKESFRIHKNEWLPKKVSLLVRYMRETVSALAHGYIRMDRRQIRELLSSIKLSA